MDALTIDRAALEAILAHARETHPEECCGAIIARDGRDVVHRFTNIQSRLHAEDPENNPRDGTRGYTPEPKELLAVLHAGEEPGARLVAFYHSHPITGSYFSGEDRARAMFGDEPAYPDVTYVVVSDARVEGEVRGFRWNDATQDFVEREVRLRDAVEIEVETYEAEIVTAEPDDMVDVTVAAPARKAVARAAGTRGGGSVRAKSGAKKKAVAEAGARPGRKKAAKKAAGKVTGKAGKRAAKKAARKAARKVARTGARTASSKASRSAARQPARKTTSASRARGAARKSAKKGARTAAGNVRGKAAKKAVRAATRTTRGKATAKAARKPARKTAGRRPVAKRAAAKKKAGARARTRKK